MTRGTTGALFAVVLSVVACAAPSESTTEAPSARGPTAAATVDASSTAATEAPAPTGSPGPEPTPRAIAAEPAPLALALVAEGLAAPINVASAGPEWLLVNERGGRVIAISTADGRTQPVLDLTDRVGSGGERGLLGLVLHPDWPTTPRAFVHYTDLAGDTVVSEIAGSAADAGAPPAFDSASERVLLTADQPFQNHNGGQLAFGPDGFLYVGLGDGGSGGDPLGHGQNPRTVLGSILRIDVDGAVGSSGGSPAYAVPPDNPFADGASGDPAVYLYGLRNPWRFSFDRETGSLWIADVGQNAFEEVNRIDPAGQGGANLGWNVMEASHCFLSPDCATNGLTPPIAEYGRERGCSVTGGYVYRGDAIADLYGWYVFGDYCTGMVFGLRSDASVSDAPLPPVDLLDTSLEISAFGEGADGELYVADLGGGALYRIVEAP